jgi:Uncharacterized protein conserved in bacteria
MLLTNEALAQEMRSTKEFFDRSTRPLSEVDSEYAPLEGLYTVAQQVAHTAQTVEWFLEGAFRPEGFDLNFDAQMEPVMSCKSLREARLWLDRAFQAAIQACETKPMAEWLVPLAPNPILGEAPRLAIISSIVDHTAHHRGALTVYSRLLGYTPPMPYMDL